MENASALTGREVNSPASVWKSDEALKLLDGDSDLLRELCEIFLAESPKLMQTLQQALSENDADALMRSAHSIKGEVSYLGSPGAARAAAELEEIGNSRDLSRAPEVLQVLVSEMTTLKFGLQSVVGLRP